MSEKKELSLEECYAISEQLDTVEANTLRCVGDPAWQYLLNTPAALEASEKELTHLTALGLIQKVEEGYALSVSQENMQTIWEEVARQPITAQIAQIGYPILAACIETGCAPDVFLASAFIPLLAKAYIAELYAQYTKTGIRPEPFLRLQSKDCTDSLKADMRAAFLQAYDFDTQEAFAHAAKQEAIKLATSSCCPALVKNIVTELVEVITHMSLQSIQEWKRVLNFNPGSI